MNKFAYGLRLPVLHTKILNIGEPKIGDIVVFRFPLLNTAADFQLCDPGRRLPSVEQRGKSLVVAALGSAGIGPGGRHAWSPGPGT